MHAHALLSLLALFSVLATLISCNKASTTTPTTTVQVAISPASLSLNVNMSANFFAAVAGGANRTVTWSVSGVEGGDSTVGTILVNGSGPPAFDSFGNVVSQTTYTAPATVPSGNPVTITATSTDDNSVVASATLTILAAAQVTVSPANTALGPGGQQTFTATVDPAPSPAVIWEVNGLPGGFSTYGFISNTGVYTAPPSPPPGGSVTITAVSIAHTTQSGSAIVTLSFGTASFQGPYAFTLKGENSSGTFSRAGSFTADGNGGITGGLEDVAGSAGVTSNLAFTGSYTLGAEGRGTLHFNDGLAPSDFRIVMSSSKQVQIISFDTSGTAAGQASLQNVASFRTSALLGTYVFNFSGLDSSGKPVSQVGQFVADGQGGIHNGLEDINDNGTITSQVLFTGTYSVNSNGRGTAQFVTPSGTYNFSLYIVSVGSAKLVSTDAAPAPAVAGQLMQQAPGATFTEGSLNGNYAFLIAGANSAGNISTAGSLSTTGNGILTNGILDENAAGTLTQIPLYTGTYTIGATGRGTAIFSASNRTYGFVFYLDGLGGAVLQETDSAITSDGLLAQQQNSPSLAGSYAFHWGGAVGGTAQQFAGQLTLDGSSSVTSGTQDFSSYPGAVAGQTESLNGALTIEANARGMLTLNPSTDNRHFVVYVVSPTKMFALETDAGVLRSGTLIKQF